MTENVKTGRDHFLPEPSQCFVCSIMHLQYKEQAIALCQFSVPSSTYSQALCDFLLCKGAVFDTAVAESRCTL
jgi:hypothetical protein